MDRQQLEILLEKYIAGELSAEDRSRLAVVVNLPEHEAVLDEFARKVMMSDDFSMADDPAVKDAILSYLDRQISDMQPTPEEIVLVSGQKRMKFWRYAAAAAVVFLVGGAVWLSFFSTRRTADGPVAGRSSTGSGGIMLTLANGQRIALDSSQNGALVVQGNTSVIKNKAGQLSYQPAPARTDKEVVFNTLKTSKGRMVSVVLSDGTRVWLNTTSSIRYPVAFADGQRIVELNGEAFFDVAKNPSMPFKVIVAGPYGKTVTIQVLGTSFNVQAYNDEDKVSTAVAEGMVGVVTDRESRLVKASQQATVAGDQLKWMEHADLAKATAWKDGYFVFREDQLSDIMKQLARWYDIDVRFTGPISDHYTGKISRNANISQVLKMLEAAGGVSFTIENNRITVLPKTM
ncbi:FecR family protein [Chitinophaga tropicalis]|uniref:DUF4974 domain-containing protein n=1 Tax=Chitinophaga tropicalis TaxID=2683588 RepID=A0A7K1U4N1_9BACT|nr:FecR family protein [Chitinophaga tropicalis]MVT09314.1 DUF4974 domain-containing protein [Chitinophaga tropicalis]